MSHIHETTKSQSVTHEPWARNDREVKTYYIEETDKDAALTLLVNTVPSCYNLDGKNMIARTFNLESIDGDQKWDGRVTYLQKRLHPKRQWDVQSSVVKKYDAIQQIKYGANAPDVGLAMNVSGEENKVEGADILDPTLRYTEIHPTPASFTGYPASITPGSTPIYTLLTHVGKINADTWRGWAAEEVRFMGMSIAEREDDLWYVDVTYEFLIKPTVNVQLPPELGGSLVAKQGWDYLWYYYEPQEDPEVILQQPLGAYFARYLETVAFDAIFPVAPCYWLDTATLPTHCDSVPEVYPECP